MLLHWRADGNAEHGNYGGVGMQAPPTSLLTNFIQSSAASRRHRFS